LETFSFPLTPFLIFLVVLARIGGLVTFAPFWGNRVAPPRVRIILSIVLALILTPVLIGKSPTPSAEVLPLTLVLCGEILIGLAFGLTGRIIFSSLEIAAHFVGSQMGFNLAGTIDPTTQAQTTALGTIAQMLGLMVLLASDGHHWFLAATIKSFSTAPVGSFPVTPNLIGVLINISGNALAVGVTLAAPVIIVLLIVEFSLELFGRIAPQFQVFLLGFPIKIIIGIWVIGVCLFFLPTACKTILRLLYEGLLKVINAV
jgi:flagellar biosynthetic protein FliR